MPSNDSPRGLATLALLKTRFDGGQDHLGLFEPFVEDVFPLLGTEGFTTVACKGVVEREHGLVIPQDSLSSLLGRLAKKGKLRRDGGRFWAPPTAPRLSELQEQKLVSERDFELLGNAFADYTARKSAPIGSSSDALAVLVGFLVDNDIVLLLDELAEGTPLSRRALTGRQTRLAAAFVRELCLPDRVYSGILERLVRGLVLQDALLLRRVAHADERLSELTVFFDTGYLFALVGAKGSAAELAARESAILLRTSGANLAAFDRTIDEMKRILEVYERHVATAEGRLRLHPTELTFHFLSTHATPSDIRQLASMLELKIRDAGFAVRNIPPRVREYTLDEAELARNLSRPTKSGGDARIQHDVDCVASILRFRAGAQPSALERCKAIFATTSGSVLHTVTAWFRQQGGKGVSPAIHQIALTNIAWLKKPASAGSLQLHELAALCEAALRPSADQWGAFKRELVRLRDSGQISTDEAVAIVADELTYSLLVESGDDIEADATSVSEVIERVRASYRAEADQRIHERDEAARSIIADISARADAAELAHKTLSMRIDRRAKQISRRIANGVYWTGNVLTLSALVIGLPGVFDRIPAAVSLLAWVVVVLSYGYQAWSTATGGSMLAVRDKLQSRVEPIVTRVLLAGEDGPETRPPHVLATDDDSRPG